MTQVFKPRDYQQAIQQFIFDHERCNIWAGMGTGKSVSVLTALQGLSLVADPYPALVLAPLRVASTTWPGEVHKWAHLQGMSMADWSGTRDFSGCMAADVVTCNYDNLAALVEHFGFRWPLRTVVADESTRLKSFRVKQGGKRAQALGQVAHKYVRRWISLTGTPAPNGMLDLWGQQWFVDAGTRLGTSYSAFEMRWFRKGFDGFSLKPMDHAQAEIEERLADICLTVTGLQVDDADVVHDPSDEDPIACAVGLVLRAHEDLHRRELVAGLGEEGGAGLGLDVAGRHGHGLDAQGVAGVGGVHRVLGEDHRVVVGEGHAGRAAGACRGRAGALDPSRCTPGRRRGQRGEHRLHGRREAPRRRRPDPRTRPACCTVCRTAARGPPAHDEPARPERYPPRRGRQRFRASMIIHG